jgi:hypothetical protein
MRTHIFTDAERDALHRWLSGTLNRADSPLLHTTLGRLRRSEKRLIQDIRLFTLALRRLRLAPKLRRRPDDMDATLSLAPILIHPPRDRIITYISLIRPFYEAQTMANDHEATTGRRLKAIEMAARIGAALAGAGEDEPDELVDQLEKLKREPAS